MLACWAWLAEVVQHDPKAHARRVQGAQVAAEDEELSGDLGHIHSLALSSTICARRQVTTDPELRRTMRSSRLPSSLVMSRTGPIRPPCLP
jgi:hypothetical protein